MTRSVLRRLPRCPRARHWPSPATVAFGRSSTGPFNNRSPGVAATRGVGHSKLLRLIGQPTCRVSYLPTPFLGLHQVGLWKCDALLMAFRPQGEQPQAAWVVYAPLLGVSVARGGSSDARYTLALLTSRRRICTTSGLSMLPPHLWCRRRGTAWSCEWRDWALPVVASAPTHHISSRTFLRDPGPQWIPATWSSIGPQPSRPARFPAGRRHTVRDRATCAVAKESPYDTVSL